MSDERCLGRPAGGRGPQRPPGCTSAPRNCAPGTPVQRAAGAAAARGRPAGCLDAPADLHGAGGRAGRGGKGVSVRAPSPRRLGFRQGQCRHRDREEEGRRPGGAPDDGHEGRRAGDRQVQDPRAADQAGHLDPPHLGCAARLRSRLCPAPARPRQPGVLGRGARPCCAAAPLHASPAADAADAHAGLAAARADARAARPLPQASPAAPPPRATTCGTTPRTWPSC